MSDEHLILAVVAVPGIKPPGLLIVKAKLTGVVPIAVSAATVAVSMGKAVPVTAVHALRGYEAGNKVGSALEMAVVTIRDWATASAIQALFADLIV